MNFLDKLVIPQSLENLILLKYILTLALIIFLPFIGILLVSSCLSVFYNLAGRKKGNEYYLRFSKEIIDIIAVNRSVVVVLGVVPAVTIILTYSQLLHASKVYIEGYLLAALIILAASVYLILHYRYTFNLDRIIKHPGRGVVSQEANAAIVHTAESDEVMRFSEANLRSNRKSGIWGALLLLVSSYIYISCIQMSYDIEKWSGNISVFSIIFSLKSIIKYVMFLLASTAISSGAAMFYYFRFRSSGDDENVYLGFIKKISSIAGIISVAALPVFVLLSLLMTPGNAVSVELFVLTTVSLLLLFAVIHLYYIQAKRWSTTYSAYIFYLLILFFAISVISDQTAFSYSTKKQELTLAANYDLIVAQAKEKAGKGPAISGKDIFDGRCSACHRFDTKLVGPAYKDVLPKYEGHMDQLIAFISNPVKKNPAFPPMPNQGLKPKEVEAIADYIMKTYKSAGK
ncbi:MAG: c-type cytochrome [Bacillota bacterium]